MDPKTRLHLIDMATFAKDAQSFLGDLDAVQLSVQREKLFAISRAIELIGEAANRVCEDDRAALETIPWTKAIGMRNRIIHAYHAVDPEILVSTIRDHIPPLIASLEQAIAELNP